MPLIPCPECLQEISDQATSCPRCGFPRTPKEKLAMIWDFEDADYIYVNCPNCGKNSKIKKNIATKTNYGYSLFGDGSCTCGLVFDIITKPADISKVVVYQPSRRSTAGILALFLGGIGIHHFYLGRPLAGFSNIFFCWTFIPAILAFVTAIQYFSMTDDAFNQKVDMSHPNFGRI